MKAKLSGALAIFVKTPGLSPLKTRLAEGIGRQNADKFYSLAVGATEAVGLQLKSSVPDLKLYWAVAEEKGLVDPIWANFPTVFQGQGTLGDRLAVIYDLLLQKHDYVCFIGADSPHLTTSELEQALLLTAKIHSSKFVLGETEDGGFYFFGGGKKLPQNLWKSVEYSSAKTSMQLKEQLQSFGGTQPLAVNFDIDVVEDLQKYSKIPLSGNNLLPEQNSLIRWAQNITGKKNLDI